MSASKYRCSFQLSVKGSWVCINVRFCVFCCNNNPEMGCFSGSCLDQPALLLQTNSSHQAVDKKESPHCSYCYLCLGNLTLEMVQETETVFGDLLGVDEFGPGWGQPRVQVAGIQMSSRVALGRLTFSSDHFQQGWRGFLQVDKEGKKKSSLGCSSAEFFQVKRRVIRQ